MMHTKYKKILPGLLALGLLMGSLAGCGSAEQKASSSSDAQSTAEDTKEETQTESTAESEPSEAASEVQEPAEQESTEKMQEAAETEQNASPEVTVERQEVDTASMIPVEYTTEEGSIGLYIPEGWTYRIDAYEGIQAGFSISVQPEGEEGEIMLSFIPDGTESIAADHEVSAEMYGYTGYQGTYDTASVWSYFRCTIDSGDYEICNNAGDFWWTDREEEANQILSTVSFGEPLMGSVSEAEQGEAFEVNGLTVTANLETENAGTAEVSTESPENMDGDIEENGADYGSLDMVCGSQTLELDASCYGADQIYVLPVSDTVSYILVETVHENDYADTYLVKADSQAEEPLTLCDSLGAGIGDTEEVTTAGFALEFRVQCLGTYGAHRHYTIYQDKFYTNDGQLHFNNASGSHMDVWSNTENMDGESLDSLSKLYTEDGRMCLTAKTDVKAYSSGGDEITIQAGTQICPTDVDLDNHIFYFDFIDFDQASGEYLTNYGYFIYDTDSNGYQITIDGTDQYELFENLPYAG